MNRRLLPVMLQFGLALAGCARQAAPHTHEDEHPEGHDHHAENHGHGDGQVVRITRWSETLELFAEHPPLVAGKKAELLAHVTWLPSFAAVSSGKVTLTLEGPSALTIVADAPLRPGIYRLAITLPTAGRYRGNLAVGGADTRAVGGFELVAYATDQDAQAAASEDHDEGAAIEFLKEQQWGVPFGSELAATGTLIAAVDASGTVDTPPGGSAEVGAPVAGRLVLAAQGLPRPGERVRRGQLLASLAPTPSSPEDAARAELSIAEAEARVSAARAAVERSDRLLADRAIPAREVDDARRELGVAQHSLDAAQRAAALFQGASGGQGVGAFRLLAPIDGTLVSVDVKPGAAVEVGTTLFRIVDARELWIRARVPEQDAARLRVDHDAAFRVVGAERFAPIDVTGDDANASVVMVARTVDPTSRTVEVIYALREPDSALRVGGLLQVSLPAGDAFTGVIVSRSALVDQDGRDVVYVQLDGEHFEARTVRKGPSAGDRTGIVSGLSAGERVVTRGAHLVRLADRETAAPAHGHIH